jgi:ribulose 1,5-bisphosphate synthetase/thiazole synthase
MLSTVLSKMSTPPWRAYSSVETCDVAIVGAGPTGLACGIEVAKCGLKSVLIEKG